MEVGEKRFVLGRNDALAEPFLVANHRTKFDGLFSEYFEVGVSDDYMEILGEYLQRQQKAYATLVQQCEARGSDGTVFGVADCLPEPQKQRYTGQVVVMASGSLAPEFRTKEDQLLYVLGGGQRRGTQFLRNKGVCTGLLVRRTVLCAPVRYDLERHPNYHLLEEETDPVFDFAARGEAELTKFMASVKTVNTVTLANQIDSL